jgi:hypothetical protein
MDDTVVAGRPRGEVLGDPPVHPGKQIVAAMDVADGVKAHVLRCFCLADLHGLALRFCACGSC